MAERRLQALPSQPQAIETRLMRMTMRQGGQGVISWSRWCHLMSGWGGRLCCFGVGVGGVKQHCWFQGGRNGAFGSALNPNLLLIHEEHKKKKKTIHIWVGVGLWNWRWVFFFFFLVFFVAYFCVWLLREWGKEPSRSLSYLSLFFLVGVGLF